MFTHQNKRRTYAHNLKLAAILSCVAGVVNITGVLSLATLTTNITGHFAYFSEALILKNYSKAVIFLAYILSFLSGAFLSSFLLEWGSRNKLRSSHLLPISIEIVILFTIATVGLSSSVDSLPSPNVLACLLLLTMGLQNALVTHVSKSVVRTTHLTGIFTDLGIELSQLIFYRASQQRQQLHKSISLKITIIACFFAGGAVGGFVYLIMGLATLFLPAMLLVVALWFDRVVSLYLHYLWKKLRVH